MKLITIVGARPQFIKAAAVSRALANYPAIREIIVHTGQHYDHNMSDIFFEEMQIPKPHFNLGVQNLGHGAMTGQMLEKIEGVLQQEKPDALMVYGDTNSTLAGALAAKKLGIPVVHVEAGLRSYNMEMPEEINRILTDRISDILFAPTQNAIDILQQEGFEHFPCSMYLSGDVMEDSALYYGKLAKARSTILEQLDVTENGYCLATLHRQENTDNDNRLRQIVESLNEIHHQVPVLMPLHPRTQKLLAQKGMVPEFRTFEPVGYLDMLQLIQHANMVITDSGGLQKESYFFNKYCIVLRDQSEWVELVNHGYAWLAGANNAQILAAFNSLLHQQFTRKHQFYGGGQAAQTIAGILHQTYAA